MTSAVTSANEPASLRGRRWIAPLLVALLALAAYWPALHAQWIWDDDSYVTENPHLVGLDGLARIWSLVFDAQKDAWIPNTAQYYPIVFTTFWVERALVGLEPWLYHLTNVALHLANALLVWRLARVLALPGAGWIAALFALHPMHVESVAWVTERKNVLSGLFYLSAFLAYLRFDALREGSTVAGADPKRARRAWAASFVLFACALLSKSVTATLPLALVCASAWRARALSWRSVMPVVPFLALGVVSGALTAHWEQVKVGAQGAHFVESLAERALFVAPRAWWHYAAKTAWPEPVAFMYERWDAQRHDALAWLFPIATVALAAVLVLLRKRITLAPALLVFASAFTLAPALGFARVYPHRYSWVADHFAYLGSLPLIALLVLAASAWAPPLARRAGPWIGAAVLVLCAWRTHVAAKSYENAEELWKDTLAKTPSGWIAMLSLGIEWMKATPLSQERAEAAFELFQRAEPYPLGRVQALVNQGQWLRGYGRYDEAISKLRAALAEEPDRAAARAALAQTYFELARAQSAAGRSREALDAIDAWERELGNEARSLLQRAWILATSSSAGVRDGARAKRLAETLLERQPNDAAALDTLAAACAELGDFTAAVEAASRAQRIVPAAPGSVRMQRLEAYRARRPWREAPATTR